MLRLRDRSGLRFLGILVAHPEVEFHAIDLVSAAEHGRPVRPRANAPADRARADGLELADGLGDAGEALDHAAKTAYRSRLEDLRDEVEQAEAFHDLERAARAREEMELVAQALASAVGLGGRDRRAASAAERARVNVTRAIKSTIRKIAEHDDELGRQLLHAVKTGTFCSYRPLPGFEIVVGAPAPGPTASPEVHEGMAAPQDGASLGAQPSAPSPAAPGSLAGRGLWTLVFTDIVGSTDHIARLGDRRWRGLLEEHDAVLDEQVRAFGGRVLNNLGDGFFIAFDSPGPAIRCAERACAGVRELGLEIRCGVHTGECELLGDTLVGMAVHIAQRVSALALPGEVLVSSTVRDLVAGSDLELSDRGAHVVRGVPGEWHVYALRSAQPALAAAPPRGAEAGESALAPASPLPPRLTAALENVLFGRADELDVLAGTVERVVAGERRAVLVSGEPGIGKTRLGAEVGAIARAAGATVLYGRCDEELGLPYQPFVEALAHYAEHAPAEILARHRAEHGAQLGRLVPQLADADVDIAAAGAHWPESDRYVLFAAVTGMLAVAAAAAHRPLVIVVDDLHWADKPTLLLLKYLLTSPTSLPMLLIGTYRSTDPARGQALGDLLADLRREHGIARIELGGLDEADVAALAEAVAGHDLDEAGVSLARTLHRETNGNPFFVGEILRHLAESGGITQAGARWQLREGRLAADLPGSVRETITSRVSRLGEEVERTLTAAAVIGHEFDVELLARVLDEDEDELTEVLDAAVEAALIAEAPDHGARYSFAHALISHTLYDHLGPARRRRTHRRVAEALEELLGADTAPRIGELAYHAFEGAAAGDVAKALDYARRAGEAALSQFAADEAVRWYARALDLQQQQRVGGDTLRCELLIGLGTAQRDSGDRAFRETLFEASELARTLGDNERLVGAALANTRGFVSETGVVDAERVAVLEAALETVGEVDSSARARLLATLSAELTFSGDWKRRLALSDAALAIARRLGETYTLSEVLSARFMAIWTPETLGERAANTGEALALVDPGGDALALFRALHWKAVVDVESGDLEEAARLVERECRLADRLRQPTARWLAAYDRATQALMGGLFDEAESWAQEAGQIATESGQPEALAFYVGQLINIRFEQGRLVELEPLIAQQVEANPGIPAFRAALTLARVDGEMYRQASEVLAIDAENGFKDFPYDSNWLVGLCIYAEAAARLGDVGAAGALHPVLAPWKDQIAFNSATAWGSVGRHVGNLAALLGHEDQAEGLLVRAAAVHERLGTPVWLARTRLDLGRLRLARRPPDAGARLLIEQALATARDLGCAGIERRAAAVLEAAP